MLIFIPKEEELKNNNLFNCNLNTLKDFFPPSPFPLPKETNMFNIGPLFDPKSRDHYENKFNNDMKPLGTFKYPKMYFDMMRKDLGIPTNIPNKQPAKYMFDHYYNDITEKEYTETVSEEKINNIADNLYLYYLLADKNLSHAKDELKRMRLSVTAMQRRLNKQCHGYNLPNGKLVVNYVNYLRFILCTYEEYMTDKTTASKQIYLHLTKNLYNDYYLYTNKPFPKTLSELLKEEIFM